MAAYRSHALCHGSNQMKQISAEKWTPKDVNNHRYLNTPLLCMECERQGRTKQDTALHKCGACDKYQGREFYTKQNLNDQQKKEKAKKTYTLVCLQCHEKEEKLVAKLTPVKGDRKPVRLCTCRPRQPVGHTDKCALPAFGYSGMNKISL